MQCHDDGSLFHIWIIRNGYQRTSTSSTTHSSEVCKSLKEIYKLTVISELRIGLKLIAASALDSMLSSPKVKVKVKVKVDVSVDKEELILQHCQ